MKFIRRHPIWSGIAFLILIGVVFVGGNFFWVRYALTSYRQQLIASGEKLAVAELIPPAIRESSNGATRFLRASALVPAKLALWETNPPNPMVMIAPGKALVCWQQPAVITKFRRNEMATNSWREMQAEVERVAAALEGFDALADFATIDFHFDYYQGFSGLLPNLAPMKGASQRLSYATVVALQRGDVAAALQHLRAMLALARGNTTEHLVISQLVRIAITAITFNATWEFLQNPNLTEAQLAILQREWAELEFSQAAESAIAMERAVAEMTISDMRHSSAEFRKVTGAFGGGGGGGGPTPVGGPMGRILQLGEELLHGTGERTRETLWRVAWSYPDQLRMLQGQQLLLETLRDARRTGDFSTAIQTQEQRLDALGIPKDSAWFSGEEFNLRHAFSSGVSSLRKFTKKIMMIETSRQLVVTVIALERYKRHHGNYPAELASLVPDWVSALPQDPVNGQPLRYRLNDDGTFTLYSIGEDGVDNGADASNANPASTSFHWQQGRDWVWPKPASKEEIESYLNQPAR
jgi:hypothetical protein